MTLLERPTRRALARELARNIIRPEDVPDEQLRYAISLHKRRVLAIEERAVRDTSRAYLTAYTRIREAIAQMADEYGITQLAPSRETRAMRDRLEPIFAQAITELVTQAAAVGLRNAAEAYVLSAQMSAMQLRQRVKDESVLRLQVPDVGEATRLLGQGGLLQEEAARVKKLTPQEYEVLIAGLLGKEWRLLYEAELDELIYSLRRVIIQQTTAGAGIPDIMRAVRQIMGIETDRRKGFRANYYRVQTLTRTLVNKISNDGAASIYLQNEDVLKGYRWLTARDERVCNACAALNGTEYAVTDFTRPPLHPNCRCTTVPIIKDEFAI